MAEIEVFRARNTTGLAINGTRVTETKPYGLIQTTQKFKADDEEITKALRIDVQPIKHGHWETWGYVFHGIEWKRCSVCGKTADVSYKALLEGRIEPVTLSLCGCCGARMDGDTNG